MKRSKKNIPLHNNKKKELPATSFPAHPTINQPSIYLLHLKTASGIQRQILHLINNT